VTHVSRVDVTESRINVGQNVTVNVWIQSDYFDVGTPYDVEVFISKTGSIGTWVSVTSRPGVIPWWGEFRLDPIVISLPESGNIYVGAKDKGEPDPDTPAYYDIVEVIPPIAPGYGLLIVRSLPSGAGVFVDGVYKGVTPRDLQSPIGNHTLRIKKEGYKEIIETITIAEQSITTRSHTLETEGDIWETVWKYAPYVALAAGGAIVLWVALTPRGQRSGKEIYQKARRVME
jgi:hypothetical protein